MNADTREFDNFLYSMSPHILSESSRILARGFCFAMLAALVFTFVCGTSEAKAPAPTPIGPNQTMIVGIDAANHTVTITYRHHDGQHIYRIDALTAIKVNGRPAQFSDLRPGHIVSSFIERDSSTLDVLEISGSGVVPAAAATAH